MSVEQRLAALHGLADAIAADRDALVRGIVRTSKKIHRVAAGEVDLAIRRLRAFGDVLPHLEGRAPLGTIAIVFPGNASLSNPVATIGNAFLAGNAVVARFPRSSRAWAEQVEPLLLAHIPGLRFDHGAGADFIRGLCADPEVRAIMVFGDDSWADPYEPLVRASRNKKFIFEGPGNDPFLVLPGADLARAAQDAVRGGYYNAGQACTSPERFYVHRSLAPEFTERVVAATREQVLGAPEREDVTVGPVTSLRVAERIAAQLADAVARGARILAGGGIHPGTLADGTPVTYVEPTVIAGVTSAMKIMRDETFGPVIAIQEVDSAAEALALADDSPYGLAASLYGGGEDEAAALAASHGQVFRDEIWIDYFGRLLHAPYGGRKRSGWVWETEDGRFNHRDGARTNAVEFSRPAGS